MALRSKEARQAKHDAAVLRDLRLCRDDKGRIDITAIPPGRRGRLLRHLKDARRMLAPKPPTRPPPQTCPACGAIGRTEREIDAALDEQQRVYGRTLTCAKCGDVVPIESAEVEAGT